MFFCLLFIVGPFDLIFSDPLSPLYIIYGNSQVFYSHSSLIPYQDFFPSSCDLQFNSFEKNFDIRYSSIFSFKNNGFALGFTKKSNSLNCIYSGYGIKKENFTFGSSLNVILEKKDPLLNLNVSSSLHFNDIFEKLLFSMNNISLIQKEKFAPDILFDLTGKIVKNYNLYYDFSLLSNIKVKNLQKSPLDAKFDLAGKYGKKSVFLYSVGYQIKYDNNSISNMINVSLGSLASISEKCVGLYFGYSQDLKKKLNTIQCNLSFNPFHYKDVTPPVVSMNITCSDYKNSGYYFCLKSNDNNESGLNSWTLVISDQPSKNGKIVRIFSGGFPMPSTVFWDKKDSSGEFFDMPKIFARLVVIDKSKNIGYTPWVSLNSCGG